MFVLLSRSNAEHILVARFPLARSHAEHFTEYGFYLILRGFLDVGENGRLVRVIPDSVGKKGCQIRSVVLEPALKERVAHDVDAIFHAQLFHRARLIHFDGFNANREALGDLLVRVAPCGEA